MSMVHDNIIKSYSVDFEAEALTLKTLYQTDKIFEKTNIVFTGYLVHDFEHAMKGSIINDIFECPPNMFLERESDLLRKNKSFGWPIFYKNENELVNFLQDHGYKIFEVFSSLGLSGFILAKHMEINHHGLQPGQSHEHAWE